MVDREITYSFEDLRRVRGRREGGDADLRFQSGWRRPDLECGVDRLPGARPAAPRGRSPRCRHGAVDVDRRVHRRDARRGAHRRPGRAAGDRDERRAAAGRTRLPRTPGGARAVRVRVGDQVGDGPGADPVRPGRGVLDAAGLVGRADRSRPSHASTCRAAGRRIAVGPVTFGGVAWAQNRGVKAVEVRIDDGPWQPAQLGAAYSNDTWRLWSFPWQATRRLAHDRPCGPPTTPAPCRPSRDRPR